MSEIIFGINPIKSLIEVNYNKIKKAFITNKYLSNNRLKILFKMLKEKKIETKLTHKKILDKLSGNNLHQGIIAELHYTKIYDKDYFNKIICNKKNKLILILDGITDPHNFGACLRNANAAGVDMVIIQKNRSTKINGTVRKVASGAADITPVITVTNLSNTLNFLKSHNIRIIGTSNKAELNLFNIKINYTSIAVIVGSEEKGMRRLVSNTCDDIIKIPMFGKVSSLNVSVTTGIVLFEIIRQRK